MKKKIFNLLKKAAIFLSKSYGDSTVYTYEQILRACKDLKIDNKFQVLLFTLFGNAATHGRVSNADYTKARTEILIKYLDYQENGIPKEIDFDFLFDFKNFRKNKYNANFIDGNIYAGGKG